MSEPSLAKKAKKGVIWSFIENFGAKAIQFVIGIILARLLSPDDYGVFGMLAIFMAMSNSIIEGGFVWALIQKKDCTQEDYSTVFIINTTMGFLLYAIMFIAAPFIADFFNMPILKDVARVEAILLILCSLMLVQTAKLTKELNFKLQTIIRTSSSLVAGLIAIFFAYQGWGVWAIVFQSLASQLLSCVLFWIFAKWTPSLKFSVKSFKTLFSFGSNMLITGLYGPIFDNIHTLIIGKFYTPASLGTYTRARTFADFPSSNITAVVSKVSFPTLSKLQDNPEALTSAYRRLIRVTYFVVFPLMLGLLAVAEPLVISLIGVKWAECIPYLQVLSLSLLFYPLNAYNINALLVKGKSGLHLRLDLVKKAIFIIILAATAPFGVIYICWGSVLSSVLCWLLTAHYSGRLINLSIWEQTKDLLPSLAIASIMAACVYMGSFLSLNSTLLLVLQILVGGIIYTVLSYLFNRKCWQEALRFAKQ